jgi:hypothetical protein
MLEADLERAFAGHAIDLDQKLEIPAASCGE